MTPGLAYVEIHRGGVTSWWRVLLGIGLLALLSLFLLQLPIMVVFIGIFIVRGQNVQGAMNAMLNTDHLTPTGLAYLNLALATAIPAAILATFLLHGWLRPGWLISVLGRVRWTWLLTCFGIAVLALAATMIVAQLVPASSGDSHVGGHLNHVTSRTRDFVLIVLLLTPLQAMGEEFAFRGYPSQAIGGLFGRVPAVVVPAILFALAHGSQGAPVFFDRFAFGLVAGVLVVVTGGLEAGIAMHILNNFLAYGVALAWGDMSTSLNPGPGSWWEIPVTLTQSLVYLGLVWLAARRLGVATRTPGPDGVLVAPAAAV